MTEETMNEVFDNTITIELYGKEFTNKETGNKFIAWHTFDKRGNKMKVKFTQSCKGVPNKAGDYTLTVYKDKSNISTNNKYGATLWVQEIAKIEEGIPRRDNGVHLEDYFD